MEPAETAFELTYSVVATPWLALQPDLQYIVRPGMDPDTDAALVVGLRTAVAL